MILPGSAALGLAVEQAEAAKPKVGKTVIVKRVDGTVKIKCKGQKKARELRGQRTIKVGCTIEATRGTVRLTSSKGKGKGTQSGNFWGGRFRVQQKSGKNPTTDLVLAAKLSCSNRGRHSTGRPKKGKPSNGLWGKAKGNYKTKGKKGSASVRGTTWFTGDFCGINGKAGTSFYVEKGRVKVHDDVRNKSVILKTGDTYTIGKPGGG